MKMPVIMKLTAALSFLLTILFALLKWNTAAITFGTICYHFTMRLLVGLIVDRIMKNRADYNHPWFQQHPWETKLYTRLRVKKWKRWFPTYDPSLFDSRKHTYEEIAQATCQAEIVHEIIAVLSFLPLLAVTLFGSFATFGITSLFSACFDMSFAIMQRFNRPRLIRIISKNPRD